MKGWIIENKTLKFADLPKPRPVKNSVVLRTKHVAVCGSDRALIAGLIPDYKEGIIIGHEYTGIIHKVGKNVDETLIGKLVAVNPYVACEKCPQCKEDKVNLCENLEIIGTHRHGGFGEYSVVPVENLIFNIPIDLGFLVQPVACAIHAVNRIRPDNLSELSFYCQNPPNILVFGGGPMGLLIARFCKIRFGPKKIFLIETNKNRKEKYGSLVADELLNPEIGEEEMLNQVLSETNGIGADIVVDAVGNLLGHAYRYVKEGGKILLFGLNQTAQAQFKWTKEEARKNLEIENKKFKIIGSYLTLHKDFKEAVGWLESSSYGKFFDSLITIIPDDLSSLDNWLPKIQAGDMLKPVFYNSR